MISTNKSNNIDDYSDDISIPNDDSIESNLLKNILFGLYVLLNIPLYSISGGDDQMLGFIKIVSVMLNMTMLPG